MLIVYTIRITRVNSNSKKKPLHFPQGFSILGCGCQLCYRFNIFSTYLTLNEWRGNAVVVSFVHQVADKAHVFVGRLGFHFVSVSISVLSTPSIDHT